MCFISLFVENLQCCQQSSEAHVRDTWLTTKVIPSVYVANTSRQRPRDKKTANFMLLLLTIILWLCILIISQESVFSMGSAEVHDSMLQCACTGGYDSYYWYYGIVIFFRTLWLQQKSLYQFWRLALWPCSVSASAQLGDLWNGLSRHWADISDLYWWWSKLHHGWLNDNQEIWSSTTCKYLFSLLGNCL